MASDVMYDETAMVLRINTHGPINAEVEADRSIVTRKEDNDKRKAVKLERADTDTAWGFTLQSYGIYDSCRKRIENYTFVDYVDRNSPAFLAGMKKGDIIFGLNGQSTDGYSHESLVEKLKSCEKTMRMVLVNGNICQKVELHQRKQKLQALLRQKQYEFNALEKREAALFYNARARLKQKEMSEKKSQPPAESLTEPTEAPVAGTINKSGSAPSMTLGTTDSENPQTRTTSDSKYLETSFSVDNNQTTTDSANSSATSPTTSKVIDVRPKTKK